MQIVISAPNEHVIFVYDYVMGSHVLGHQQTRHSKVQTHTHTVKMKVQVQDGRSVHLVRLRVSRMELKLLGVWIVLGLGGGWMGMRWLRGIELDQWTAVIKATAG